MTEEVHISSLVVLTAPVRLRDVEEAIGAMPGAMVHGTSPAGKMVVTLEAETTDAMLAMVNRIQRTDGVLSAAMVYQCSDSLAAMNEEIPDAH
ncbi:chaperone NapD [Ramlibacter sp. PS3R-8]|uniref:chaperone NapD n=1 Tax=Ramlibacter sp. PS3R-8 TaxID=3133437 RepID=UPI0030AED711